MKAQPAPRTTGTVKWYDQMRGYGYIVTADYREIFAHRTQVADGAGEPTKGKTVKMWAATVSRSRGALKLSGIKERTGRRREGWALTCR